MKLILYIGHHKVGSTTLQQFLAQNSHALLKAGILYPAVESEGLSYMLKKAMGRGDVAEHLEMNVREPHNALAFRMWRQIKNNPMPPYHRMMPSMPQVKVMLDNQVAALAPDTIILCSEVMANFGKIDPLLIDQICEMFGPVEMEIYAVLRRPDAYMASWHGQRLRFGARMDALRDGGFETYQKGIHFNYRTMLEPWTQRCANARFHLRSYDQVLASGGSVEDFTATVGAAFPKELLPAARLNSSYPHALYEIVRQGNHGLKRPQARTLREGLMLLSDRLALPSNSAVELYGAENRARLHEAFQPVEAWLRATTGQPAFFTDLEAMLVSRPRPELDVAREVLSQIQSSGLAQDHMDPALADFLSELTLDSAA